MQKGEGRQQKAESKKQRPEQKLIKRSRHTGLRTQNAKDGMQRIEGGKRKAQPEGEMRITSADAEKSWPANSRATAELI